MKGYPHMQKFIVAFLVVLLVSPVLTRADQESNESTIAIAIESEVTSDQPQDNNHETLVEILSEAGIELNDELLKALNNKNARIKIIKTSGDGENHSNSSFNKKIFISRTNDGEHRARGSNAHLGMDHLNIEVSETEGDTLHFIKGIGSPEKKLHFISIGGPTGHAEEMLEEVILEEIHSESGMAPGAMHWFEKARDGHPMKQKMVAEAATCIIKNLSKVNSSMAAKLLREACISLNKD